MSRNLAWENNKLQYTFLAGINLRYLNSLCHRNKLKLFDL